MPLDGQLGAHGVGSRQPDESAAVHLPARAPAAAGAADYAADEGERLFYAGDFTSRRAPGFEAAALSGLDAASALKRVLGV